MPRGDKKGPESKGPMTGRGLGLCAGNDTPGSVESTNQVRGLGRGMGRGFGRGARPSQSRGWGFRFRMRERFSDQSEASPDKTKSNKVTKKK